MDDDWKGELEEAGVSEESLPTSGVVNIGNEVLVPVMSEEEVVRSIASRGKKMVALLPPGGITGWEFRQILASTFMLFTKGKFDTLPSIDDVAGTLAEYVTFGKIKKCMNSPQFRYAMLVRGVDYSGTRTISAEQEMAIAIMATPDGRPFEQKLKSAGVAPSRWRAWLKQKYFKETWEAAGGNMLKDHEIDMVVALTGQALRGDVGAIKYAFEVSGKHNPARQTNVDATIVISQILEIVQEEVKDVATLQRIAARMQMVASTPASQRILTDSSVAGAIVPLEQIEG